MSLQSIMFNINASIADRKRDRLTPFPAGVSQCRNVVYMHCGHHQYKLDVYFPDGTTQSLPTIVSIHGGGYVYGSKELYRRYCMDLARRGFSVVNFNYRLAPQHRFPAPLEDINAVMEWICSNKDTYHLDPSNIFLVGDSAGAYLAGHYLALWSNPDFAARFDFRTPRGITIRGAALNCGLYRYKDSELIFKDLLGPRISPQDPRLDIYGNITGDFPPAFVMTSHYDFLREDAMPMYECLNRAGVPAVYRLYGTQEQKHMGHVFHCNLNLPEARQCNADQCEFFRSLMQKE